MKYIRLPNGNEIEFYNYAITNSLIVKFIDKDFNDVKGFFGSSTIQYIDILDEDKNIVEHKDLGGMRRTTVSIEQGIIIKNENKLISEAYDETIEVVVDQDEDGNDIMEEQIVHHDAVYDIISKEIPVEFIIVILERPSFEEQINELRTQTGIVDITTLDINGWKNYKQEENKKAFAEFLNDSYVEFNEKHYGVTEEDQTEMSLNYMQYNISKQAGLPSTLEWHAKKEKCVSFTESDFLQLSLIVKSFVYPYMNLMQEIKEQIYACKSIDEVKKIKIEYSTLDEVM